MQRVASGDPASRQAITCVNAEQASKRFYCGSRPSGHLGKAAVVEPGEQPDPCDDPAGVVARACLYRENGRNTGDLRQWARDPTERPRGTGRAGGGVG